LATGELSGLWLELFDSKRHNMPLGDRRMTPLQIQP
jgi:hypothetical protein